MLPGGGAPADGADLRGAQRVDGELADLPLHRSAEHADPGVTLSSGGGITATFYEDVIDPGTEGAFYVYPATAGCYALQVDGASFDDVIVITAG